MINTISWNVSQIVYLSRFLTKTSLTNNGQMIKVISHSYIIGLHELYNFVKYCKYDSGFWESGDWVDFLCLGVGGFWGNGTIASFINPCVGKLDCYVSYCHLSVCYYKTSHTLYSSPGIYEWCIQKLPQSWVQQERGWVWNNTLL